ncbi:MAG: response regulator [Leptolyngbyaceae bacterium]|nr:response regulator [Leptolyngbyaceae bacterium]
MSDAKELEIRLQFLDEALDYLNDIDAALIGVADRTVDLAKINAALRAAHSVKGGASVMRFTTLSELSHRLEDALKVLKIRGHSLDLNAEVERLLLAAVDCINTVVKQNRQRKRANQAWLRSHALPIFDQLHDLLGEPQEEDASSILMMEEEQDIVVMLFQTEVEGCLQRLEAALANDSPRIQEEVEILAQELGGLAEMMQLGAFGQLCQSIERAFTTYSYPAKDIAASALEAWRRSQALVITHQLEFLPTTLDLAADKEPVDTIPAGPVPTDSVRAEVDWVDESSDDLQKTDPPIEEPSFEEHLEDDQVIDVLTNAVDPELDLEFDRTAESAFENETRHPVYVAEGAIADDDLELAATIRETDSSLPGVTDPDDRPELPHSAGEPTSVKFEISEEPDPPSSSTSSESTVRVPTKQLNQLSDLLGELIIERNRLNLEVKTLQTLIQSLTHRSQTLNQANTKLRTVYDTIATQTTSNLKPSAPQIQQAFQTNFLAYGNANGQSGGTPSALTAPDESNAHVEDFDGLEMDRYGSLHSMFQEIMETMVQIQEVTGDINVGLDDTSQTTRDLNKTTKQLQSSLTQLRMRPLSDIVDRFPRALRELSLQYNKPVQLQTYGGGTLVDRNILEALNEPLLQLIRNAFDHGIEDPETRRRLGKPAEGLIEIRAFHRNNRTIIIIRDDGQGISLEKVRSRALQMGLDESLLNVARQDELLSLIFEPGFSTAEKVTSLSGRGVGMDIVRNKLKQIRGEIKVDTQQGRGTTFTIAVPFTLSVARVLLAESNHMMLAFPIDVIEEMIPMPDDHILTTLGSETFDWQGNMVQLVRLSHWLKFNTIHERESPETPPKIDVPTILMVTHNNQLVGVQVDRCWGEQEVAIRKVEGDLPLPTGFNNCTILGDGRVVPLVNIPEMLHWIISYDRSGGDRSPHRSSPTLLKDDRDKEDGRGDRPSQSKRLPSFEPSLPAPMRDKPTIMVVDDSINVRRLLALTLEKAGYRVIQAKDGQDALEKLAEGVGVHAVICDIEMPRLDGYGFLVKSRASTTLRELPVVMLTSRSGQKHRVLAKSLGASAYFSKPYNERSLLQTLEGLVNPILSRPREIPVSVNR